MPADSDCIDDLGFRPEHRADGSIAIRWQGRVVTTVRGVSAARLRRRLDGLDSTAVQQLLARATGNFRRGDERLRRAVPPPPG